MALVDRYLQAVKFWLPRNQKDDIIAELSEDLRSQIADLEAELGRKVTDAEVEPILKRCGSPMAVAGRYMPQQSLIGPVLFPIYRLVTRALFFYYLLPWLVVWVGLVVFSPHYRAAHPGATLLGTLEPWWLACTHSLFICTLVFAWLDRSQARSRVVDTWNPRSLPAVRDTNRISRGETIFELTMAVAGLAIWVQLGAFHRVFHVVGVTITLSSRWPYFFWAVSALSLGGIVLACLNLVQPRWTRLSASLRLGIDAYSFGLGYWLFRANLLQSLSASGLSTSDAAKLAQLVNPINFWMVSFAIWVLVVGAVVLAFDIRRILRVPQPASSTPGKSSEESLEA
jgi:hypothetical protein